MPFYNAGTELKGGKLKSFQNNTLFFLMVQMHKTHTNYKRFIV